MDNVRILKGYSKDEQKELENNKELVNYNDLSHIIADFISDTRFNLIWEKYNDAEPDEQISIIRDILDFYTDKAKLPDKKYILDMSVDYAKGYVKHISAVKTDNWVKTTLSITFTPKRDNAAVLTEQEIKDIDPRYMQFAVEYAGEDND